MSSQPNNYANPYPLRMQTVGEVIRKPKWGESDYIVSDVDLEECEICKHPIHGQKWLRNEQTRGVVHAVCRRAQLAGMTRAEYESNAQIQRDLELESYRKCFTEEIDRRLQVIPGGSWTVSGSPEYLEAVKSTKLRKFVDKWHEDELSVLMLGPSGEGKSASAAALARRMYGAIECRPPAGMKGSVAMAAKRYDWGILCSLVWVNGFDIANAKRYSPLGSEPAIIAKCKAASLLIVDEVGQESYDGTLFEIVEARYSSQAPTIVTSGLHKEEFLAKYGSGMYRRLTEKPFGTVINLWPAPKGLEAVR